MMNTDLLKSKIISALEAAESSADKAAAYETLATEITAGVEALLLSASVATTVNVTTSTGPGVGTGTGTIS